MAFDRSVRYEIETVKGLGNIFFGGEGLFLTKLTGPGRVLLPDPEPGRIRRTGGAVCSDE
ncbi:MAG: AIM24 family protein [Clostridium sp.]